MIARKSHFQRVESQVDVGAVLIAARRHVALHHMHRVLRHLAAVLAGSGPIAVGDLSHNFAPLFQRFQYQGDIKFFSQRIFNANLDVVKIDKNCQLHSFFGHKSLFLPHLCFDSRRVDTGFLKSNLPMRGVSLLPSYYCLAAGVSLIGCE